MAGGNGSKRDKTPQQENEVISIEEKWQTGEKENRVSGGGGRWKKKGT